MELFKQGQAVMYAEQPMIVIDYPSVLQAVNEDRWEGRQSYVGGSVWNNFLDRQSYLELKPRVAETATAESGGSSTTLWIVIGAAIAVVVGVVLFILIRRNSGRAVEK